MDRVLNEYDRWITNGSIRYNKGLKKYDYIMVTIKDKREVKTLQGNWNVSNPHAKKSSIQNSPKYFVEKLKDSIAGATCDNLAYLNQSVGKPIADTLKGLAGY